MNAHSPRFEQGSTEPGALPSSLRFRNPQMTGQFLHEAGMKTHLFFQGEGDVPRSFTVLVALGYKASKEDNLDLTRNGLAVIDNDNWRIVADNCLSQSSGLKGASQEQRKMLETMRDMNWSEFMSFCRSQATYRAGSPDIDQLSDQPFCGNHENQEKLGLRDRRAGDARNDFIRSLHESGEYNLPSITRDGMINELLMRQNQMVQGRRQISWDVGMNFDWDRSGRVQGGEDLSRDLDVKWRRHMDENPDILRQACDRAVAPYVKPGFNVLELGNEAACEINLGGQGDKYLMLSSFSGQDMSFSNFRELREKLNGFDAETLLSLWATVRVLDKDLSRPNRAFDVSWELNDIRASHEDTWLNEADEEVCFAM